MRSVKIYFITDILTSLKSGSSLVSAEKSFEQNYPILFSKINFERQADKHKQSSIMIELELILSRGRIGYPVMKSLIDLRKKASDIYLIELDKFIQKTPFLAMLPLFLFYLPALILIFIGPFIRSFLEEVKL